MPLMRVVENGIDFPGTSVLRLAMARKQSHRGPHPKDILLFSRKAVVRLCQGTSDLCWLLSRGYALRSASELVGNRYTLTRRQRMAISRCACSDEAVTRRRQREITPAGLRNEELWIDGYNVLTALESALAGGVILLGRDGCCRDVAGIHRRHRRVDETKPALQWVGKFAQDWAVSACRWWLDRPVANSGRLKAFMLEAAEEAGWPWSVELVYNPDRVLAQTMHPIATSDSAILDRCQRWVNLTWLIVSQCIPQVRLVDLSLTQNLPSPSASLPPEPSLPIKPLTD
jgi:hypothetical protein